MQATLAPSSMGIALGARSLRMGGRALVAAPARPTQQIKGVRPVVAMAQKTEKKGKEQEVFLGVKGNAQLLGMKGASAETNIWKIRLQLMKPVTWIPLIWGVLCGAAASGNFEWTAENCLKSALCMLMSGPLLTGYTQTINDWYDRDIDAINEPYRPIPSGAISEGEVKAQIWALLLGGIGVAYALDTWAGHDFPIMTALAAGGSFISYIYSAPPLKLKQSGWAGNYALGSSYIALPWWAGQALFGTLTLDVCVLTILYSIAGLGIAIVNDFKSIEGDRAMGLQSLPVAFGVDTAKWICVASIDATQLGVAAYLAFGLNEPIFGAVLLALILPQIYAQYKYFLPDPVANDVKYQASAQPFLVFGLLTTGLAIGAHNSGAAAAQASELVGSASAVLGL
ncbi:chlorophyll synthetase [Micractinium conductrix]|uniref:Chlorophyll synthetase n=1 Tax=Micractinium conductrix TaxID=554055 RepID=A0A2P6VPN9_9CHLO|nr:chlorophyll synthetase [Micractinium conductrix]|eukprot:PSC76066.1 chlorophyll synthetase [Micractinium conductrix]